VSDGTVLGSKEGNEVGDDDEPVLGLLLGIVDGMKDGNLLGTNDGIVDGKALGVYDGVVLGSKEGNKLGADDGSVLGFMLGTADGVYDCDVLGTNDSDGLKDGVVLGINDGQVPQVALQVWKTPAMPQFLLFAIAQVLYFFLKKNSAAESVHGSQVLHVSGQCELTLS